MNFFWQLIITLIKIHSWYSERFTCQFCSCRKRRSFGRCFFILQVFLQIDWAMKWLQLKYRESQGEFFEKRGLPWRLTHIIRLKRPSESSPTVKRFEHPTVCHVFNYCGQTDRTVVSILHHILKALQLENRKLEKAYLRAHNAGYYHGSELLLAIKTLYEETGVMIRRIDFSESQIGKERTTLTAVKTKTTACQTDDILNGHH